MKIVCPSRKRSDIMTTDISGMVLLVAESERDDYAGSKFEVVTQPDLHNLSSIRQFALDTWGDVFFVDDDLDGVYRLYITDTYKMTPDEAAALIERTAQQAQDLGAYLYGFNNDPNPTHYNQHKPFMFEGYINGCAMGVNKGGGLSFNPKTVACESHWLNLLNTCKNRYCFIDKRFCFRQAPNTTFRMRGGQTGRRTMQTERDDTILLRRTFGESVAIKKEQNKTKQLFEYQRVLKIKL